MWSDNFILSVMLSSLATEYSLCWCASWNIVDLMEVEKVETT